MNRLKRSLVIMPVLMLSAHGEEIDRVAIYFAAKKK